MNLSYMRHDSGIQHQRKEKETKCHSHHRFALHRVLSSWTKIAGSSNINYFLKDRTLLGAFTHRSIIDCDDRLEVFVDHKQMPLLEKLRYTRPFKSPATKTRLILQKDWKVNIKNRRRYLCNGTLVSQEMDVCSFTDPTGRLIFKNKHIDIFTYVVKNNQIYDTKNNVTIHQKHVFPLKRCSLFGEKTYCPRNSRYVLALRIPEEIKM